MRTLFAQFICKLYCVLNVYTILRNLYANYVAQEKHSQKRRIFLRKEHCGLFAHCFRLLFTG